VTVAKNLYIACNSLNLLDIFSKHGGRLMSAREESDWKPIEKPAPWWAHILRWWL